MDPPVTLYRGALGWSFLPITTVSDDVLKNGASESCSGGGERRGTPHCMRPLPGRGRQLFWQRDRSAVVLAIVGWMGAGAAFAGLRRRPPGHCAACSTGDLEIRQVPGAGAAGGQVRGGPAFRVPAVWCRHRFRANALLGRARRCCRGSQRLGTARSGDGSCEKSAMDCGVPASRHGPTSRQQPGVEICDDAPSRAVGWCDGGTTSSASPAGDAALYSAASPDDEHLCHAGEEQLDARARCGRARDGEPLPGQTDGDRAEVRRDA